MNRQRMTTALLDRSSEMLSVVPLPGPLDDTPFALLVVELALGLLSGLLAKPLRTQPVNRWEKVMKVLVMGATGGTGRAVVAELLRRGHGVTAFSRSAVTLRHHPDGPRSDPRAGLRTIDGDAADLHAVKAAVAGHDAVVVTLGISESALRVRLRGPAHTAPDIRSRGTRNVVAAMRQHGVTRLVVQSVFGIGDTAGRLGLLDKIFYALLIRQQVADHARQEHAVRASGLDWTIVQPVHLADEPVHGEAVVSARGEVAGNKVARSALARVLADAVEQPDHVGASITVSTRGTS
ncbi:MAG: NAD(P)-dependent oxidoreductase [Thermocrispum sp.]